MSKNTTEKPQGLAYETDFKGKPVLSLHRREGDKFPLRFGVAKAGLILANLEAIKAFHTKHQGQAA